MGWMEFVLGIATLVLGTGWLFTYRAYKRKNEAEASQAEAEGWAKQQHVYQTTIADLEKSCDFIRADRNLLREENAALHRENVALRGKINDMENTIFELKKEVSRLGRRVDAMSEKKNRKKENDADENK